jgi:hypothetical protein
LGNDERFAAQIAGVFALSSSVVALIRGYEHREELAEEREWTCASGMLKKHYKEFEKAYEVCMHFFCSSRKSQRT